MCGILAMAGRRWADDFDRALDTLSSRGPDARGVWRDEQGPVLLGHRRLAIIDLSGGAQPMLSPDGRYALTFNGEIYNYLDLRRELEACGHRFQTHSDTEVLLHALIAWGKDALVKLDGIFAFALWDSVERKMLAARDRFGIKPLMYSRQEGGFVLSSTLAAFFALRGFPRPIDPVAVREYLACQSIPAPHTMLKTVAAVRPACWVTWSPNDEMIEEDCYWSLPSATDRPMAFEEFVEASDAALAESVRRQMVADVPLGAFLSGGIDSSLMVHYMAKAINEPVKTFSVRFEAKRGYDESSYARTVAEQLDCEHHEFDAAEIDAAAFLESIAMLDQPLADPAYLPTLSLSKLTRQHVTVAISGDGGDELFGGYERFLHGEADFPGKPMIEKLVRSRLLPASLLRRVIGGKDRLLWDRVKFGPFPGTRKDMASVLALAFAQGCRIDDTMAGWLALAESFSNPIDTDALIRADCWTYLSDNCLVKTDRASMAHCLEVRVPILGNPVADLALPQPAVVKLHGGMKAVLKNLAQRRLPREVWDRPKHGFSVPLRSYFIGSWRGACDELVSDCGMLAPFLNGGDVQRRWRSCLAGREDARTMYTLLVLLAWLRSHEVDG